VAKIDESSVEEQPLESDTPLFRTAVAQYEDALDACRRLPSHVGA
jgi:hypothetical protein